MVTNCRGDSFKIGDKITGLYGFGTFISGTLRMRNKKFGIFSKRKFWDIECFEGGFDYTDFKKKEKRDKEKEV